jgi:hypothetical protein
LIVRDGTGLGGTAAEGGAGLVSWGDRAQSAWLAGEPEPA